MISARLRNEDALPCPAGGGIQGDGDAAHAQGTSRRRRLRRRRLLCMAPRSDPKTIADRLQRVVFFVKTVELRAHSPMSSRWGASGNTRRHGVLMEQRVNASDAFGNKTGAPLVSMRDEEVDLTPSHRAFRIIKPMPKKQPCSALEAVGAERRAGIQRCSGVDCRMPWATRFRATNANASSAVAVRTNGEGSGLSVHDPLSPGRVPA
jgi:hypothetical protein